MSEVYRMMNKRRKRSDWDEARDDLEEAIKLFLR